MCKECDKIRVKKYQNSDGYWNVMLNNAKTHSITRKEKGRIDAGVCNLTLEDLQNKWNFQNGKCYYSNIKMIKRRHSDWACSLERLNNLLGYTDDNTVLICQEFNTSTQWNLNKIKDIPKLLKTKIELLDSNLNLSRRNTTTINKDNRIIDGIEHGFCRYCKKYIPLYVLHKNFKKRGCIACIREYTKNVRSTLSGYLSMMVSYSRANKSMMSHNIDIDLLKNIYKKQEGKCAYSGIPLRLPVDNIDWVMSIERIDTTKGYVSGNVCLICREFNSMDRSILSNQNSGSCGWNNEKFNHFITVNNIQI
jgi:hypothetical protein